MRALRLLPLLCLAGCYGGRVDAPSLLPRAVEKQPVELPDAVAEAPDAPDPALDRTLAGIVAQADEGHRRYLAERRDTAEALARGRSAPQGSDLWLAAETARSALASARQPVSEAAIALDGLRIDPAHAGPRARAAIEAASAHVAELAAAERDDAG